MINDSLELIAAVFRGAERPVENASGMDNPAQQDASKGNVNHRFGDIDMLFVVSKEALLSDHSVDRSLNNPALNR